jgi:general stress protein 26
MKDDSSNDGGREKLWELIKDMRFAMFTTHHADGHLHSRPMTTQNGKVDEGDSLWFFMSRSSEAVSDLLASDQVNVAYADPGKDTYVSVSGRAALVEDPAQKKRLWSRINDAWFPGGPDDPEVALVRVSITHAHYWDVDTNKVVQLIKMLAASVTDRPPHDMGKSAEVRMR